MRKKRWTKHRKDPRKRSRVLGAKASLGERFQKPRPKNWQGVLLYTPKNRSQLMWLLKYSPEGVIDWSKIPELIYLLSYKPSSKKRELSPSK